MSYSDDEIERLMNAADAALARYEAAHAALKEHCMRCSSCWVWWERNSLTPLKDRLNRLKEDVPSSSAYCETGQVLNTESGERAGAAFLAMKKAQEALQEEVVKAAAPSPLQVQIVSQP